jgi:hypothetical protein
MKKGTYPISLLVKTSHKKFENPQNDKKKIEDVEISKYENKRFQNSHEERHIPCFLACEDFTQKN